jgi:DNA-binding MarR family transcriptional regulator
MKKICESEVAEWDKLFAEMKDTLLFQMHRIHTVMFRVANRIMHEESVPAKMEQIPVLMCIYNGDNLSQQEVADIVHRDKSSVQRTVVALERKGLIKVEQDEKDKRRNILRTTEAGDFIAAQLKNIMRKTENELFESFQQSDKATMIASMKAVADKLEHLNK